MPKTHEVYLTVKEADEADFDKPLVRIHQTDKPRDIKWGDYIDISLDKKNWVTSRFQPAGDIGMAKYISASISGDFSVRIVLELR